MFHFRLSEVFCSLFLAGDKWTKIILAVPRKKTLKNYNDLLAHIPLEEEKPHLGRPPLQAALPCADPLSPGKKIRPVAKNLMV